MLFYFNGVALVNNVQYTINQKREGLMRNIIP